MTTKITFFKKSTLFLLLITIILSCKYSTTNSKTKDSIPPSKNKKTTNTTISGFKLDKINHNDLIRKGYKNNLQIISKEGESSFDAKSKMITIKTPVFSDDYKFTKAYNISNGTNKAILYVITNEKTNEILHRKMNYLSNHIFSFTEIQNLSGAQFDLKDNEKLFVAVLNDVFKDYSSRQVKELINEFKKEYETTGTIDCKKYKILAPEPKEACGGVIIDL